MHRVCYVLSTSETTGGANKSLLDLLEALDRTAVEPYALLRRHGPMEEALSSLGIPSSVIPYTNAVTTTNPLKDTLKRVSSRSCLGKIERFLDEHHIDLVHNNSMPALAGMEAAYRHGTPYICHLREDVERGLGVQFLNKQHHLSIAKHANKVIAISEYVRAAYEPELPDIVVMHDGMNIEPYYDTKDILQGETIIASIYGNLDAQKGQLIAVKAWEILASRGASEFELRIVGNQDTQYANDVRHYIEGHTVPHVTMVPNIADAARLKEARHHDDINIVCSSAEGLGRVTIEGMLSGNLVLAANAGATSEIVSDQNTGILFTTNDPESLADALMNVACNREQCAQIAKDGQAYAGREFDIHEYARTMLDLYDEATS